jgi:hypothetical protein
MPYKTASPCTFPGCGAKGIVRGRCNRHKRGTTVQRGYDNKHKRTRSSYELAVLQGRVTCWRCAEPILPTDEWDLGHDDNDRSITKGPEHANRCNRSTAAKRRNT